MTRRQHVVQDKVCFCIKQRNSKSRAYNIEQIRW